MASHIVLAKVRQVNRKGAPSSASAFIWIRYTRRPTATGLFSIFGGSRFGGIVSHNPASYREGDGDHMALLNKVFTTRTLVQIIVVLVAMVIMKAASLHYGFSWASALAAG
jgi:hypothetical protein